MIELSDFLKLLYRRKIILIIIPLITVIVTVLLVRSLPDTYISETRLATGFVDKSQQILASNVEEQESKIAQKFDNLIQTIKLKKILDQVSYRLILHDLNEPNKAFRPKSKDLKDLNAGALKHAKEVYTEKYATMQSLSLSNEDEKGLARVVGSMRYDNESIAGKLNVFRVSNSDFVIMQFESENPQLSAFVLNTLTEEVINFYARQARSTASRSVNFLDSLMKMKKAALDVKLEELKQYKITNRVLNLNEQAKVIYGQISDFETKREGVEKDVISYSAALREIDSKFSPTDRRYLESKLTDVNLDIVALKERIKQANSQYIQSNFDPAYAATIDSLKNELNQRVHEASDSYIYNPMNAKDALVSQKLNMEIARELAKNSEQSIASELIRLNEKLDMLVPNEAVIQSFESSIDVAGREYLEILQKYNQASMESNTNAQLRQVEKASPGRPQPSKKMLLVILSGIISFVFCVFVFFVLFYFDRSINSPKHLASQANLPVLGQLNKLRESQLDLINLWDRALVNKAVQSYKDLLRDVRFEIENDLKGEKVLAITSFCEGEGKTFVTVSLAYAFSRINKKVLIIDGNFLHPDITRTLDTSVYVETLFRRDHVTKLPDSDSLISVAGNKGGDNSILEITDRDTIDIKFRELKRQFDIILIEAPALSSMSKAKEWTLFADRVVAVFEAGKTLKGDSKLNNKYLQSLGKQFSGFIVNKFVTSDTEPKQPKPGKK